MRLVPALLLATAILTAPLLRSGGVAHAADEDSHVSAELEWTPHELAWPRGNFIVPLSEKTPTALLPPPGLTEGRYGKVPDGLLRGAWVFVDIAKDRERIWIDTNRDGQIRDEKGIRWTRSEDLSGDQWFARAAARVRPGGAEQPTMDVRCALRYRNTKTGRQYEVAIGPAQHRTGTVELAGRVRDVALVDADANLRFDDDGTDTIYIDVDGDGRITEGRGSHEAFELGSLIRVGDEGWVAAVGDPLGGTVEFLRLGSAPEPAPRRWVAAPAPPAAHWSAPPRESLPSLVDTFERSPGATPQELGALLLSIGRWGNPNAFAYLDTYARSEANLGLRAVAVSAMGNPAFFDIGADVLARYATHGEGALGAAAVQALHRMGHPGRERTYTEALKRGAPAAKRLAIRYLAYTGTAAAEQAVRSAFAREADAAIRYEAYMGMRSLPSGPGESAILTAARSRIVALQTAGIRDAFVMDLPAAFSVAMEARGAVTRNPEELELGRTVVDVLASRPSANTLDVLLALAGTPTLRHHVVMRLGSLRAPAETRTLTDWLQSRASLRRTFAAEVLGHIPRADITKALLERLEVEEITAPFEALVEAVAEHRSQDSVKTLLARAKNPESPSRGVVLRALAGIAMDVPEVRRYFVGLLGARDWEERVHALRAAAGAADEVYLTSVLANLKHKRWQVRTEASRALAAIDSFTAVDPLIAALEKERHLRVKEQMGAALHHLTGVNYYDDPNLWGLWRADHPDMTARPGRPPDSGPAATTAEAKGGRFYGIMVRSNHVVFVLDRSASMDEADGLDPEAVGGNQPRTKQAVAHEQLLSAIGRLPNEAKVNVVLFESKVTRWARGLRRLSRSSRAALTNYLRGQAPTGATNLYDALEEAIYDPDVDTVFVLSDGAANVGKYTRTGDISTQIRRLNRLRQVTIHCVSVGHHSALLMRLARESGGQYVRH